MRFARRTRRGWLWTLAVAVAGMLSQGQAAFAWKPKTHAHLAEVAYKDAVDDGLVTIYATDYRGGSLLRDAGGRPVIVGSYRVNPAMLDALRKYPAQFRAGVLGPDAYPDILTGQQIIHPAGSQGNGETNKDLNEHGPGPDPWLSHLWSKAYGPDGSPDATGPNRAFVAGYLTHAAGDIFGHTLINHYTGDAFHFTPTPENAIKHVVLEGYIGARTTAPDYDARIDQGVDDFIYRNLVDAQPGSVLSTVLLRGDNAWRSPPAVFSVIKYALVADIKRYYDKKADFDRRIAAASFFDAIGIEVDKAAFQVSEGPRVTYEEHWRDDITDGLRAWPEFSHELARAIFYNPDGKVNLDRVRALCDDYINKHLLTMLGAPDVVGDLRGLVPGWVDALLNAIGIPELKQAIDDMKRSLFDYLMKQAFGMTATELAEYLGFPELKFNLVLDNPDFFREGGNRVTRADFDRNELHLSSSSTAFDHERVPAAYNTVVLTKLLMMDPAEVNRLMGDLGSSRKLTQPVAILGYIGTLDGSNQWSVNPTKMVAAEEPAIYTRIFMRQTGEKP